MLKHCSNYCQFNVGGPLPWACLFVISVCVHPSTALPSVQMYTPLHAAAASGQISVVKLLLELGVEVDAVNIYGNTALHVACLNGQDIVVSKLLEFHAAVNAVNHKGMVSPLFAGLGCLLNVNLFVPHLCHNIVIIIMVVNLMQIIKSLECLTKSNVIGDS